LREETGNKLFGLKPNSFTKNTKKYIAGHNIVLLTMQDAIKFNTEKRTEGGKMIASALKTQTSYPISNILV